MDQLVKSAKRVSDHGEVFTGVSEVNAMLDLVLDETKRIDSRFLEPACGNGNFLIEVLKRKFEVVELRYRDNQKEFERYSLIAVSSLYGIDILADNVIECRERLLQYFVCLYRYLYKESFNLEFEASILYVLSKNILWGDALTFKVPEENGDAIVFSEWSLLRKNFVKRRDFSMVKLLNNQPVGGFNLFSDLGDNAFIPIPVKEFALIHIFKLSGSEDV